MGNFDLLKKKKYSDNITESVFECKRDGFTIRGTEYRPQGEKLPIAIVSHGFMAFQDTVRQYAILLAEMGYVSYCFDFCGGCVIKGKSDGPTTEMSVLTEVKDLEAVVSYARQRPYANPDDLTLMGCSQGGFVSAIFAAKQTVPVSRLVLFYPALCIPDDARAGKMMMAKFDPNNIPEHLKCGPMKLGRCYVADVIGMDSFEEIKDYPGEVLIVHGTKDQIVNLSYAKRAYETYAEIKSQAGDGRERVTLHIIENGAHGFSKKHDVIAMNLLRDWLKK